MSQTHIFSRAIERYLASHQERSRTRQWPTQRERFFFLIGLRHACCTNEQFRFRFRFGFRFRFRTEPIRTRRHPKPHATLGSLPKPEARFGPAPAQGALH